MDFDRLKSRQVELSEALDSMRIAWPKLRPILAEREKNFINALVGDESDRIRGRVQELRDIMNLPELVNNELQAISDTLSDEDVSL